MAFQQRPQKKNVAVFNVSDDRRFVVLAQESSPLTPLFAPLLRRDGTATRWVTDVDDTTLAVAGLSALIWSSSNVGVQDMDLEVG